MRNSLMNQQKNTSVAYSLFRNVKYEHLVAGVSGGVTSTLVLHPLDLLKIRFAVSDGFHQNTPHYKNLRHAVKTIVKEEGISGLYKGVVPNCWGAGAAWGFYFLFYNAIKAHMLEENTNGTGMLGPGRHMLAAAESGVLTLVITNPIWVVKTRLCLQYAQSEVAVPALKQYSGMLDAFSKVYRYEGITGLYKGFVPGIFGVSHGALQFMAYEEMKDYYVAYYKLPHGSVLGTKEYLAFAALSKLFAALLTYPYQVVRARLQDQHKEYKGVMDVVMKTWRFEGVVGYYKGLAAYMLHVMPNICIVLLIYETLSRRESREIRIVNEEDI